ncbi:MAG: hypothetical protein EU536_04365 [Promethearchaeota archaeon]|nr:MAG: hypothetical protein EU536_04365 [Candidatus Lokiarchaeota archaeon]
MKLEHFYSSSLTFTQHVVAGITDSKLTFPTIYIPIQWAGQVAKLNMEVEARWLTDKLETAFGNRKFPYIVVGAPSGGISQFCIALEAPFLPCHFLRVPIYRRGKILMAHDPDDIAGYFQSAMQIITPILANNVNCNAIIHYDPIHDRPLVSTCHTLRFKYRTLPEAYKEWHCYFYTYPTDMASICSCGSRLLSSGWGGWYSSRGISNWIRKDREMGTRNADSLQWGLESQ